MSYHRDWLDRPELPCTRGDNWTVYDALIENVRNAGARHAAANLCGACPIRHRCLRENRHEDWAKAVRYELRRRAKAA